MAWLVMIPMMEVQEAFGYVRLSFSLGLCLGKVILPFCIDVPEVFDQKEIGYKIECSSTQADHD